MKNPNAHHKLRVWRAVVWLLSFAVLTFVVWIQFFKDEEVRVLPSADALPPFAMGAMGPDYFLGCEAEMVRKKLTLGTGAGLPDDITKCAPEHAKLLLEEAPRMRAWVKIAASSNPVSKPYWRVVEEDAAAARAVLFAKAQELTIRKEFREALEWLEPCKRLEIRRAQACRTLEELEAVTLAAARVDSRILSLAEETSSSADVVEALRVLMEPVATREIFLKVLDREFRERWSEFAGEEADGSRFSAEHFLPFLPQPFYAGLLARSRFKPRATCNLLLARKDLLARFALLPESRFRGMAGEALRRADKESGLGLWSVEPNRAGRIFTARVLRDWLLWEEAIMERETFRRDAAAALRGKSP